MLSRKRTKQSEWFEASFPLNQNKPSKLAKIRQRILAYEHIVIYFDSTNAYCVRAALISIFFMNIG